MPATLRLPVPAAFRPAALRARPTWADAAVGATFFAAVVVFSLFIARNAARVPYNDEYCNLGIVFGDEVTFASYWTQHNEHRIPLPKLVYVAAVRAAGYDFRAPLVVSAALLVAATAFLLWVARRVRGRTAPEDVFLPLAVLGLGGWENLIWGFQVQFVLSTVFALALLGLVALPGFAASTARIAAAGVLLALLPLCGANGLALVPALAAGLAVVGVRNLWSGDATLRRAGVAALAAAAGGVAVLALYFMGLQKAAHHPPPASLEPVVASGVNFLGLAFGPVTHLMHTPGYDRPTVMGMLCVALVAVTGVLLVARLREPDERARAVMLGSLLGGFLCLAAGLAYGRAGMGNLMGASRYITLAMPVPVVAYLAWVALGGRGGRRVVPVLLAAVALGVWLPNTEFARAAGGMHAGRVKAVERQLRAGVPVGFVTDGNRPVHPGTPDDFRRSVAYLAAKGVYPFTLARPDLATTSEAVPLRVLRTEGVDATGDGFRVTGGIGTIILALPEPRHAHGLALTYEAARPGGMLLSVVSWDRCGAAPPAPGCAVADQLAATAGPVTTRVFTNRTVDALRVDLVGPDATFTPRGLAVLTRAD